MTIAFDTTSLLTRMTILFAIGAVVLFSACGKRKAPQPPVERVRQRVELKATQQGNKILLSWKLPVANAPTSSVLNVERADIYRLATPGADSEPISEEDFASDSTLISTVKLSKDDFGKQFEFADALSLVGQQVTLRYAVRLVNTSGQKAAFSNFVTIQPAAKVAAPPEELKVAATQDAILISWKNPLKNIDDSTPPNLMGVNVYRAEGDSRNYRAVNRTPVTDDRFLDADFEFGKTYSYYLRAVSLGTDGAPVESGDSERAELSPRDTFAPAAPESVTIAASTRTISIFFASNTEKDVVGYKVFRSADPSVPEKDWMLVTQKPLATTTFQDDSVEAGKTYYYYIVAVDRFGNVSEHSIVVSETVPQ